MSDLWVSSSQFEQYRSCHRAWWFQRVLKLPRKAQRYQAFGTVLHGVLERYIELESPDDNDLYPSDWHVVEEGGQRHVLGLEEQSEVRKLFEKGLAAGVIEKRFGQQKAEHKFEAQLSPGVKLTGVIDVIDFDADGIVWQIQDHKTAKGTRYIESENSIAQNQQLLLYAAAMMGEEPCSPDGIYVRHNQFVRKGTPNQVRQVTSPMPVELEKLDDVWERAVLTGKEMKALKDANIEERRWAEVPEMQDPDACSAYGGCSFASICTRARSVEQYRKDGKGGAPKTARDTFANIRRPMMGGKAPDTPQDKMDPFAKKRLGGSKKKTTKKAANPISRPQAAEAPAEEELPQGTRIAPWARPDCKACKGTGMNSKGASCRVCDSLNKKEGSATSVDWGARMQDGVLTWEGDESLAEAVAAAEAPDEPVEPVEEQQDDEPEPEETEDEVIEDEPEAEEGEPEEPEAAAEEDEPVDDEPEPAPPARSRETKADKSTKGKRGRKPMGMKLFIGCYPMDGVDRKELEQFHILEAEAHELFREEVEEEFYEVDAFQRRDILKRLSAQLEERWGTRRVYVPTQLTPDARVVLEIMVACSSYTVTAGGV